MSPGRGAAPRRWYLVRHGETEGESSVRLHGRNDVPLSALGRSQVAGLAAHLRGVEPRAIVHSPLSRAAESARILAAALGFRGALETVDDLREIDFGDLEGLSEPEIAAAMPDFHRCWRGGEHDGFPGGETLAGFAARVGRALDAIAARHVAGDVLVVAHKGIVKRALARFAGVDEAALRVLAVDLASVTVVEQRDPRQPGRVLSRNRGR